MINQKLMSRNNIIISGLIGLAGAVLLTAFCLLVVIQEWLPPLLTHTSLLVALFLFLAFFSVAEIPVMIFGLRRILASDNPKAHYIVLFTNAAYTLFAAVYAVPFILLSSAILPGLALAGLALARFVSSIIFLPHRK